MTSNMRHGGRIIADQLAIQKVKRVFTVPGESYLALLDGLLDVDIENVNSRHEGGAAMMAEAHGKITGRPGVAIVTRGPGATNATCGVHIASQDSTPMLLLVGQVPRKHKGREAFQEIDIPAFFGPIVKWAAEIDRVERIPELISRAFHKAMAGRPGPVVLSLPEDMLHETVDVADSTYAEKPSYKVSSEDINSAAEKLMNAKRPIVIVGGSIWSDKASQTLGQVSRKFDLPVMASFRRQDYLDNRHENYIGDLTVGTNPKLEQIIPESDCILVLGSRLADATSQGYKLPGISSDIRLALHVYPNPDEFGYNWLAELPIVSTPLAFLTQLNSFNPPASEHRKDWLKRCCQLLKSWQTPSSASYMAQYASIVKWLSNNLPADAIATNGAGNYAAVVHRYFTYKRYGTQIAPTSGSMGYGLPAGIAAKLHDKDRVVVNMAGDGCLQMTINEMATALQYKANVITIVANNNMYGTIRMHQEKHFPGRVSGTNLVNPEFAKLAQAFGGHGETVVDELEFPAAFERSVNSNLPAIIEVKLKPE